MNNEEIKLYDAEYSLAEIVWEQEPIGSGELAREALERMGWKRTTTYTVLKRLCVRGVLRNDDAVVTAVVKRQEMQRQESKRLLQRLFDNSLPDFVASFVEENSISHEEAELLKGMIDRCREEERR